ncbi:MAG: hypothetical protein Kow0062_17450 [Acidobacteriota bacterium]
MPPAAPSLPRGPATTLVLLVLLTLSCGGEAGNAPRDAVPAPGRYRAAFEVPAGEIPFEIVLERTAAGWRARLVNGDAAIPFDRVDVAEGRVILGMPHFDSRLVATLADGGRVLEGHWERRTRGEEPFRVPFHAERSDAPRFRPLAEAYPPAAGELAGRWEVRFDDADAPSLGIFEVDADGSARGTFLASTGDDRFLAGRLDGRTLRLSGFDGARALLVRAELTDDGRLAGDLWSRDADHARFSARRLSDDESVLPDGFTMARWDPAVPLDELRFLTLDGREIALGDPSLAGRARLVEILGTWCPNCSDSIVDLVALAREYGPRGLSVVGIAFELEDDLERNRALVEAFRARYGVDFPLLLGGTVERARSGEALPGLRGALAYPTLLFVDGRGQVTAVHVGWAGPATGDEHRRLVGEVRRRVEALLAGPAVSN